MSIQEISVSNNQKKSLLKAVKDQQVLFQDDNGDLVVNVEAYEEWKELKGKGSDPIEEIVEEALDYDSEYFVFS